MRRVLICSSLSLTLSLWGSAAAFLVPPLLQVLFSFAVLAFQRGRERIFSYKPGRRKAGESP